MTQDIETILIDMKDDEKKEEDTIVEEKKEDKSSKVLKKAKEKLKKSASFNKKFVSKEEYNKKLQIYDSEMEYDKSKKYPGISTPSRITPDIEKILFTFYLGGASVHGIWQQYGSQMSFSLSTLQQASKFYMWAERKQAIQKTVMKDADLQFVNSLGNYMEFFNSVMEEGMIRFLKNSMEGKNDNPFNELKIKNIKDFDIMTRLMMDIVKTKEENRGVSKSKLSDKKASKILEILAEEENNDKD